MSVCHGVEGTHMFCGKKAAQRCGRELGKRLFTPVPEDFLEHGRFAVLVVTNIVRDQGTVGAIFST